MEQNVVFAAGLSTAKKFPQTHRRFTTTANTRARRALARFDDTIDVLALLSFDESPKNNAVALGVDTIPKIGAA
jgi:hypothetical protein